MKAMQDLNDLVYFAHVVDHRGFAPAARALAVPKSRLSRRIAALEQRLGVRLIQRSTRRFSVWTRSASANSSSATSRGRKSGQKFTPLFPSGSKAPCWHRRGDLA